MRKNAEPNAAKADGEAKPKRDERRWPPRKKTKLKVDKKADARKEVMPVKPGE